MVGGRGGGAGYVSIEGGRIETKDGSQAGVLRCDEVDLLALEPRRIEAAVAAFDALLRSLSTELALTVGVQRGVTVTIRGPDPGTVERQVASVVDTLLAVGLPARRLGRGELRERLAAAGVDLHRTTWAESARHAAFGGRLARAALLDHLPGGKVQAGWLAALIRCPVDAVIAIHFIPTSRDLAVRLLGRRLRNLSAHRLQESERGMVPDAAVEVGLRAARELRDRLARNAGRPLRLWITAVAYGEDEASLDAAWARLRSAFAATGATCRPAHFEHRAAALSVWGLGPSVGPGKLVDSQAAASCIPWLQTEIDDPDGYRIGRMVDSGLPVSVAPFDETRHVNANIGIFAASGQGKSFLIGGLLIEARRHGVEALVVDPEGEYRELMRRLGGSWVDLITEAAIDPFDLGQDAASACATVVDVCALLYPGITEDERTAVETAARVVLGWRRAAVEGDGQDGRPPGGTRLRECARLLDRSAPRVARVLTRFLDGSLAGCLDRPTSPVWSEPLLAVSHREVREELVPVTTYLLGRMLWQIARHSPRRRHIVIDEVGMLSAHPALRSLLAQLARRARKYGSSLVVATQNVQDLLATEEGTVVASNCAILLCGGHRAVEVAAMERAFGLTEEQRRRLERAGRGEFVLLAGNRRGIIEVDLPDLYDAKICGSTLR
jgi:hypothetical protein